MSRSSLEKQYKYQTKNLQQRSNAIIPTLSYQIGNQTVNQQLQQPPYILASIPSYAIPPQVPLYAPIPLTGDDEDYEPTEINKNILPMHGNTSNFNINTLLHSNILQSEYFRALYQLRTYHEVLQEIQSSVIHVEPWQTGTSRIPSSAFCLLLKLMLMKVTIKQMKGMLNFEGFPAIRAIGFIYLRYTCPPPELWKWFEEYLEDEEEIQPSADRTIKMTIGQYCKLLLTEMNYFGQTQLPRIPVPVERKIKVMLLLLEEKQKRRKANMRAYNEGSFRVGSVVRAIYSDEENEPAWYDAIIDSFDETNDQRFWVTFTEYGNKECVDLGDMELPGSKETKIDESKAKMLIDEKDRERDRRRSRSRDRSRERSREQQNDRGRSGDRSFERTRDRSRDRSDNLLDKVMKSSRDASTSVGKNYGHRPASYKGSLSLKLDRFTVRRQSPSPDRGRSNYHDSNHNHHKVNKDQVTSRQEDNYKASVKSISYEQQERMKSLKDKYGDASISTYSK